jgi:hypothetical protein
MKTKQQEPKRSCLNIAEKIKRQKMNMIDLSLLPPMTKNNKQIDLSKIIANITMQVDK